MEISYFSLVPLQRHSVLLLFIFCTASQLFWKLCEALVSHPHLPCEEIFHKENVHTENQPRKHNPKGVPRGSTTQVCWCVFVLFIMCDVNRFAPTSTAEHKASPQHVNP